MLMVTLAGGLNAQAQAPTSQYFPQTGHSVQGEFLRFFNTRGGLEIFGYPLTETFVERGRLVQYFQRARMEAHPEKSTIVLGLLAEELGHRTPPIPASAIPAANDPNRHYYPETGHTVAYAFMKYMDTHGGLPIFGYPITEFQLENGRIVQYFQRARMEWHPEMPADQRVQLGRLGEIYATTRLDASLLQPGAATLAPSAPQIVSLYPTASVSDAIVGSTGWQTLHLYVVDQRGKPVKGASSVAVVDFPTGARTIALPATDDNGHTQGTFDLGRQKPGEMIAIEVRTSWAALVAGTQTSFLVWW